MQLKEISYYKTGGTFDRFYSPATVEELALVMKEVHRESLPFFLLGAGSNSLVMDEHWPGATIVFSKLNAVKVDGNKVTAQAGLENTRFSEACWDASLEGASWMNWLPGQIGSTVRMNARCYGGEISQIANFITTVNRKGEIKRYQGEDVFFGYKDTLFMKNEEVVAEVTFALEKGDRKKIRQDMDYCKSDRESKHQFLYPSCGCVFKNDYTVGLPSGLLLENADVRRLSNERVEISPYHANFVFNKAASARDILLTSLEMRELVYKKFGVWLEFEVELLGIIPEDLKSRIFETRAPDYNKKELEPLRIIFNS